MNEENENQVIEYVKEEDLIQYINIGASKTTKLLKHIKNTAVPLILNGTVATINFVIDSKPTIDVAVKYYSYYRFIRLFI